MLATSLSPVVSVVMLLMPTTSMSWVELSINQLNIGSGIPSATHVSVTLSWYSAGTSDGGVVIIGWTVGERTQLDRYLHIISQVEDLQFTVIVKFCSASLPMSFDATQL